MQQDESKSVIAANSSAILAYGNGARLGCVLTTCHRVMGVVTSVLEQAGAAAPGCRVAAVDPATVQRAQAPRASPMPI
jgi:hypothetical protein